ncbi:MAG TPA: hypothetical protein VLA43_04950, partial [Longimicrobiales bacterium]|nr:hypothetical protein [Longimicrobiales bacterium]
MTRRPRRAVVLLLGVASACASDEAPPEAGAFDTVPEAPAAQVADTQEVRLLRGMMTYMADAPRFTDCASGLSWSMAQEDGYLAAERAYLDAGAQGEPLLVTFQGRRARRPGMEGGEIDVVVVTGFLGAAPGEGCGEEPVPEGLEGTEWRLVELPGASEV